ncbi:unnamed protein product [Bursaphelenchus okinawaensis]|uniref:Tyrosine-protein kinase n=1 Tax=Bursaphelenchus okinawaensis TaxID=465554 RepID=A0A811LKV5_9BILA|nr:unnamed protein product [Bursaphelenchus okinawaensis]CAG9125835.1 unnamed protein product [Bursaphelenchus okinawaensis]
MSKKDCTLTTNTTSGEDESKHRDLSTEKTTYEDEKLPDIHFGDPLTKDFLKLGYYHGLLPRDDVNSLLTSSGSYLVRLSPEDDAGKPQIVLSVNTEGQTAHFVVQRSGLSYFLEPNKMFGIFEQLILHYESHKTEFLGTKLTVAVGRQKWQTHHKDIILERKVGSGNFGLVFYAKLKTKKEESKVAVKICKDQLTKVLIKEMMDEARIMRSLDHVNVVKFLGVAVDHAPVMIIMKYVEGGSLQDYLRKNSDQIGPNEKLDIMALGAARGLAYVHSQNIIHRDIAARNLLISIDKNKVLLTDFGLSREGAEYKISENTKIPFRHLSPETLSTYRYTTKTDVYSFGVLVWEIFTDGMEPYPEKKMAEVRFMVAEKGHRLEFPPTTPKRITATVKSHCWDVDPAKRKTMDQIISRLERVSRYLRKLEQSQGTIEAAGSDGEALSAHPGSLPSPKPRKKGSSSAKKKSSKNLSSSSNSKSGSNKKK